MAKSIVKIFSVLLPFKHLRKKIHPYYTIIIKKIREITLNLSRKIHITINQEKWKDKSQSQRKIFQMQNSQKYYALTRYYIMILYSKHPHIKKNQQLMILPLTKNSAEILRDYLNGET